LSDDSSAVLVEEKKTADWTMEDYLFREEAAFKTPVPGDIVDGVVVRVDADEILVDIGFKAEGVISSKEMGFRGDEPDLQPGDEVKMTIAPLRSGAPGGWWITKQINFRDGKEIGSRP